MLTAVGCDSITLINGSGGDTTPTVGGGVTYSGLYSDTLLSVSGCDSIITLDLTIVSPVNNVDSTICFGDSVIVSRNGTYRDTLVGGASNTCDSIVVTVINSTIKHRRYDSVDSM